MKAMRTHVLLAASLLLWGLPARAQAPLAEPLADFDKLVSQLKISNVVGEPIRTGNTAVIPFAKVKFELGGGGAFMGFGGGMGAKTVPMGILIVEGDDVRAERFPEQEDKAAPFQEIKQAILDRKIVLMVNGLNVGNASGTVQDLSPLVSAMMGQTTFMVNGLNLGNLSAPAPAASSAPNASLGELKKLLDARKYVDALALSDTLIARDPEGSPDAHLGRGVGRLMAPPGSGGNVDGAIADFQAAITRKPSPEAYYYLGEALKKKGLNNKAAAAYKKALELRPNYPEASKALAAIKKQV